MACTFRTIRKCGLFITVTGTLVSCAPSAYYIHTETPATATPLSGYKSLCVSWLDLHEADWKKYGYDRQEPWQVVIKDENINGLQPELKKELPGKTIHFAGPNEECLPDKGDLYIKLVVDRFDKKTSAWTGGHDDLYVDVRFLDMKTQKELYSGSIQATSRPHGLQSPFVSKNDFFEGRLDFTVHNLCLFLRDKLGK